MKIAKKQILDFLDEQEACEDAIGWFGRQKTPKQAWHKCERGDWLIWFAEKLEIDNDLLLMIVEHFVGQAIKKVKKVYKDPAWNAWADKWLSGEDRSASAAESAAERAAAWAAARAAESAAWAERVESAARAAARSAAGAAERKRQAKLVREYITWDMIKEKLKMA